MEEKYVTHELDGVGEFRAKVGTATHELAGAASFWNKRALAAEKALSKKQWGYFWAGSIVSVLSAALTLFIKWLIQ